MRRIACVVSLLLLIIGCQAAVKATSAAAGGAIGTIAGPAGAAAGAATGYVAAEMYFQEEELDEREQMLITLATGKSKGLFEEKLGQLFWWAKLLAGCALAWVVLDKFFASKKGKRVMNELREEIDERFNKA